MGADQIYIRREEKSMKIMVIYILISVLGSAIGQLMLKKGMSDIGPLTLSVNRVIPVVCRMATNPYVITGMMIYAMGTIFWLTALSRVDLSFAYPFVSLSYIIMLIGSWYLFNEHISVLRVVGTVVVIVGVLMISRS